MWNLEMWQLGARLPDFHISTFPHFHISKFPNLVSPRDGLLVLDFSRVLAGPYCTMQLGDLGARVIKIEQPGRGDDTRAWGPPFVGRESAYFLSVNRNKESLALDLKHPRARPILDALLSRADVVVENFRPGTMERLGLGYAAIAARYPRIVYCSISGFGQTGPRRAEPGYDAMMQAEGGLMSITGAADGPPFRLGVAIGDIATGMFAVQGILAALFARERSAQAGRGQHLDIAMLDAVTALLTYQASIAFTTGGTPARMGNRHPSIAPYDTFAAADGTSCCPSATMTSSTAWRGCWAVPISPPTRASPRTPIA